MIQTIMLTLWIYWLLGCALTGICELLDRNEEEFLMKWAIGLLYPVLYVAGYPFRACTSYSQSRVYVAKHGVKRWQYIFGRRVKAKYMNPLARLIWKGEIDDE